MRADFAIYSENFVQFVFCKSKMQLAFTRIHFLAKNTDSPLFSSTYFDGRIVEMAIQEVLNVLLRENVCHLINELQLVCVFEN